MSPYVFQLTKSFALTTELSLYEQVLVLYNAGNWPAAKKEFSKFVEQYPQIFLYTIYLPKLNSDVLIRLLRYESTYLFS